MRTDEVRRRFLDFFVARDHVEVPSAPLPTDDPTLLLVNAGMVPFKPFFLGERPAPFARAASAQKVVRTVDIEEVGRTSRHMSYFVMLGNFSFGDYFSERAAPLAWELLTSSREAGGYGLDPERLWVTVFETDDETAAIWTDQVGVPAERVQRRGMADNFWSMGVPGPCGPCTEIFYDRGPSYGREGGPVVDDDRYVEIWNLVLMQLERGEGGGKDGFPITGRLPRRNVDTGAGLERLAAVLQDVPTVYDTDHVRPVLDRAAALAGVAYGVDDRTDVSLRVVADHVRTATVLVGDGVTPGNEGRDYVLRRLLRRAVRSMRVLGHEQASLVELGGVACDVLGGSVPVLAEERERVLDVLRREEEAFSATLRSGSQLLGQAVESARAQGSTTLAAERAFVLHDTYGFPVDLTLEMAREAGLDVDVAGFEQLMAEQRGRAKADAAHRRSGGVDTAALRALAEGRAPTEFTGYATTTTDTSVVALLRDGGPVDAATAGEDVEVVLERTPFYAEAGGQLADTGTLEADGGARLEVRDVQRPVAGLVVHRCRVASGEVRPGAAVHARVDEARRRSISRSHTATHLLHTALREVLGDAATQAGSENSPGRLRFDLRHGDPVAPSQLADATARVNQALSDDLPVHAYETDLDSARAAGALALFGESYGDTVRVVEVGDWARELCGGTHALRAGQVGVVHVVSESSVGSGVRRVEALVGTDASAHLAREAALLAQVGGLLRVPPADVPARVEQVVERLREAERALEQARAQQARTLAPTLAADPEDVAGTALVAHVAETMPTADAVRALAQDVRGRLEGRPAVVAVVAVVKDKPVLVVATTQQARERGHRAGQLVRQAAGALGGGGGGRDDVAQGGGTRTDALDEALAAVRAALGGAAS